MTAVARRRALAPRPAQGTAPGQPPWRPWRPEVVLICAGLFLCSSDRFLAADFGGLTLKPSYVFLGAAAALVGASTVVRARRTRRSPLPGLLPALGALLAVYLVAATTATSQVLAITQLVVIAGGAVIPLLAIGFGLRRRIDVERGLTALFAGTLAAATFGFYQFLAPLLGLPIPASLAYTGAVGGLGRISAWSYEPAFYVFHLELTLALAIGDVLSGRRRFRMAPELPALFLLVSLLLANARIGFLSLPLLVVIVLRASSDRRRIDPRAGRFVRLALVGVAGAVLLGLPLGVNLPAYVASRVVSVTNTQEAASNAVRVDLYGTEVDLAREKPWLGYGPGNIGLELVEVIPAYRGVPPQSAPANNLVLQSVLDAGVLGLVLTVAFVAVVIRGALRSPSRDARLLLAGASAVLLVNAMTASLFWDLRLWAVLGLAFAAARTTELERPLVPAQIAEHGSPQ